MITIHCDHANFINMPSNKNAVLRYNTIDRCLQNSGKRYYIQDLLNEVNKAIEEASPGSQGIQRRQLYDDIAFMRSESGYTAPIESQKDGRKAYYYYDDRRFSINKSPLTSIELDHLADAMSVLDRISGAPQFEWIDGIRALFKDRLHSESDQASSISFESNIDYAGYEFIEQLFNASKNEQVLRVTYKPFGKDAYTLTFHPHHLRQYNNRWFAFGLNQEMEIPTWNMALDRIQHIHLCSDKFKKSKVDWEERLYDVIGVTIIEDKSVEEIKLRFTPQQAAYISTKPIHPSQKHSFLDNGALEMSIKVIPNFELEQKILSFGENVEVIAPKWLRSKISQRIIASGNQYT